MSSLDKFKQTYITECFELLTDMEDRLVILDPSLKDTEQLNAIFRCAHSIKGGAGAFGLDYITKFTHQLEALLDMLREHKISYSNELIRILLQSVDILKEMLQIADNNAKPPENFGDDIIAELMEFMTASQEPESIKESAYGLFTSNDQENNSFLVDFKPHPQLFNTGNEPILILRELSKLGHSKITVNPDQLPDISQINPTQSYLSWHIEIQGAVTEEKIREVFEFVSDDCDLVIKNIENNTINDKNIIAQEKLEDAPSSIEPNKEVKTELKTQNIVTTSIRVDLDKVDRLVNIVGELVITEAMLHSQVKNLQTKVSSSLLKGMDELSQLTRELQEAVMSVRMQPVKSIFSRITRVIRDLSIKLQKDIKVVTSGENTEVDKTVIEQLNDPLTHMIRNSIDHGIESQEVRLSRGKNPQGIIALSAIHKGGKIVIEIEDDGGGINREKVLAKAKEKNLIAQDVVLTDQEIDNLIFIAGLSTADKVSDVSGRGVGMDVVQRNIQALGGLVTVTNNPGYGTLFTVCLPLTLAILDGMIVRVGQERYIIPITVIIESMRPRTNETRKIEGYNDVINVRGEFIPILYLYKIFNISNAEKDLSKALVVLVETSGKKLGLVVDELIGQQQVVIKSLEENTDPVKGISGATILGDGQVSLILEANELGRISNN